MTAQTASIQNNDKRPQAAEVEVPHFLIPEIRSDHAGETGAVWIYIGMAWASRHADVKQMAVEHCATEREHLTLIEDILPRSQRSILLPLWRVSGFMLGALPALVGPRAVQITVDAVETFVDHHYQAQIDALEGRVDGLGERGGERGGERRGERGGGGGGEYEPLRKLLIACQADEIAHRDEARAAHGGQVGALGRLWSWIVGSGSAAAVVLAKRV